MRIARCPYCQNKPDFALKNKEVIIYTCPCCGTSSPVDLNNIKAIKNWNYQTKAIKRNIKLAKVPFRNRVLIALEAIKDIFS
jgi:hypothetical protein